MQGGKATNLAQQKAQLEARLEAAAEAGVVIVDPRQTFIAPEVELRRLRPGCVLHPGSRISGSRSFIGAGAEIGSEGPATLVDAVFGPNTHIASGYVSGAVLLEGASLGGNAHVREGTLLEEQASCAHAVGLKHTILLAFVTLGSLINFCDALVAGGTSRKDHSEIGSGFIHFNFTPWGKRGDKATPSLVGDVPRGVFYRESRIFLGGAGGMVGPRSVDYGAVAAAGQVVRHDIGENRLVLRTPPRIDRRLVGRPLDGGARATKNVEYISQLVALRSFYREVRLPRSTVSQRPVLKAADEILTLAIAERQERLASFLEERSCDMSVFELEPKVAKQCPLSVEEGSAAEVSHLEYIATLDDVAIQSGVEWLRAVSAAVVPA